MTPDSAHDQTITLQAEVVRQNRPPLESGSTTLATRRTTNNTAHSTLCFTDLNQDKPLRANRTRKKQTASARNCALQSLRDLAALSTIYGISRDSLTNPPLESGPTNLATCTTTENTARTTQLTDLTPDKPLRPNRTPPNQTPSARNCALPRCYCLSTTSTTDKLPNNHQKPTTVTYGPPTTLISELDLAIVNVEKSSLQGFNMQVKRMLVLLLIVLKEAGPTAACSSSCSLSNCDCGNRGLTSVPQDLPTTITELYLYDNQIITLKTFIDDSESELKSRAQTRTGGSGSDCRDN
ncbi:Leucine-rich repeat-containing protein 15 [Branchiostoma belcheri]|nr:Leucine-rich repeat-containing protein 15 [Branchiostoma belcheri]